MRRTWCPFETSSRTVSVRASIIVSASFKATWALFATRWLRSSFPTIFAVFLVVVIDVLILSARRAGNRRGACLAHPPFSSRIREWSGSPWNIPSPLFMTWRTPHLFTRVSHLCGCNAIHSHPFKQFSVFSSDTTNRSYSGERANRINDAFASRSQPGLRNRMSSTSVLSELKSRPGKKPHFWYADLIKCD